MTAREEAHFDAVCAHLLERRRGLTLPQLAAAGAIARELGQAEPDAERLGHLCTKARTTVRALRDYLSHRRRGGSGEQLSIFGGSGAGPAPVSFPAPHGSDPCARAAISDRTGGLDERAA